MTPQRSDRASVIGLFEEIFCVVGQLRLSVWALYFMSTFPFVLASLYFWLDMAHHVFAYERLAGGAIGLTVLFVAMKTGQALFCYRVLSTLTNTPDAPSPNPWRVAVNQLIVQPSGLVALPLSAVLLAPFPSVYAFYQNVSVLDDGETRLREVVDTARRFVGVDARQNHLAVWLLCPHLVPLAAAFFLVIMPLMQLFTPEWTDVFIASAAGIVTVVLVPLNPLGIIVAINWAAALVALPTLLRMLFGIETPFTISMSGIINPAFLALISALTYLTLDPLMKIAYALRCFYARSLRTGDDLRIRLHAVASRIAAAVLSGAILFGSATTMAQDPAEFSGIEPAALDQSIEETLDDRQFAWRFPRERPEAADDSFLVQFLRSVGDGIAWAIERMGDLWEWFRDLFPSGGQAGGGGSLLNPQSAELFLILLLAMLIVLLAWVGLRTWRRTQVVEVERIDGSAVVPDLEDEQTTADELPANEWLELGQDLLDRGEVRLAMRAYFFAGLARLGQLNLVRIAPYKSNRDYTGELSRVSHVHAELLDSFQTAMREFESVWYGDHRLEPDAVERYLQVQERISRYA